MKLVLFQIILGFIKQPSAGACKSWTYPQYSLWYQITAVSYILSSEATLQATLSVCKAYNKKTLHFNTARKCFFRLLLVGHLSFWLRFASYTRLFVCYAVFEINILLVK